MDLSNRILDRIKRLEAEQNWTALCRLGIALDYHELPLQKALTLVRKKAGLFTRKGRNWGLIFLLLRFLYSPRIVPHFMRNWFASKFERCIRTAQNFKAPEDLGLASDEERSEVGRLCGILFLTPLTTFFIESIPTGEEQVYRSLEVARAAFRECIELSLALDDPLLEAHYRALHAGALIQSGNFELSEAEYQRAYDLFIPFYKEEPLAFNSLFAYVAGQHGIILNMLGKREAAMERASEALAVQRLRLPQDRPEMQRSLALNLALTEIFSTAGRYQESLDAAEIAYCEACTLVAKHGENHLYLKGIAAAMLGLALSGEERYSEAGPYLREALDLTSLNSDAGLFIPTLQPSIHHGLGHMLKGQGDDAGALAEYRAAQACMANWNHRANDYGAVLFIRVHRELSDLLLSDPKDKIAVSQSIDCLRAARRVTENYRERLSSSANKSWHLTHHQDIYGNLVEACITQAAIADTRDEAADALYEAAEAAEAARARSILELMEAEFLVDHTVDPSLVARLLDLRRELDLLDEKY